VPAEAGEFGPFYLVVNQDDYVDRKPRSDGVSSFLDAGSPAMTHHCDACRALVSGNRRTTAKARSGIEDPTMAECCLPCCSLRCSNGASRRRSDQHRHPACFDQSAPPRVRLVGIVPDLFASSNTLAVGCRNVLLRLFGANRFQPLPGDPSRMVAAGSDWRTLMRCERWG
jgi:hypothetical protein